jgi:hypothetical protein
MTKNNSYQQFNLLEIDHTSFDQCLMIGPKASVASSLSGEFLLQVFNFMELVAKDLSINGLIITAPDSVFRPKQSAELSRQDYADLYNMLLKINHLALLMPQTIVRDFGCGASDLSVDFLCSADLKIMAERSHLNFDHLNKGLTPASLTLSVLSGSTSAASLQQWLYSSRAVETKELVQRGILCDSYELDSGDNRARLSLLQGLVERINAQSPTARMQCKRMIQENFKISGDHLRMELAVIKANLSVGDYLQYARAAERDERPAFVDPCDLKKMLQVRDTFPEHAS